MNELASGVYNVSVLNPGLRVFDVEMCTNYGTSYNSYVVCGASKIAIIDANHATFADEWLAKIEAVLEGRNPHYLVLNHTEPDHSGAVLACLEKWPSLTIVCSNSAALMIKNISNRANLAPQTVKDGDSLDLGGLTLEFFNAPFLHWPDTMFTWLPERKIAFTCDFLGVHFCEPQVFDHRIVYSREYATSFAEYYGAIMAPFAPWVLKGLEKLELLSPEIVATSHGPLLTRGCLLEQAMENYRQWSTKPENSAAKISVFYCSAYGYTRKLAERIVEGISKALPQSEVCAYDLVGADLCLMASELNSSSAFLLGSPTINKTALPTIWSLLAHIDAVNIVKRPVALFGSYGWSGEALPHLAERLSTLKAAVYETQFKVQFAPTQEDLAAAEAFGNEFAQSLK
ncbi:MAG: FprA family A-type flavoprotein [Coriobacteriia bacterium]|nr:FprA family A-type flavoprotein [Coriobacteriia bacterium]MCL2750168.1 FprA family A-type flavoprotein [Coriobacteriia bacterium]